ncbi:MAG: hypothetical protein DMG62_12340 [Acidobacteria bacterium]|nr:MAG: hypothetical protein DMG63_18220 [Acidobacteriota bacterium]PYY22645.1 MAG: hypothetical protein DMG62_12340 [Acidobacteriota bacterium]
MTASPKLNPGSPGIGNSGTKLFEKSKHEEPFGVSRVRNHAGKSPVDLNSVAQVTTDNRRKTNCDAG